METTESPVKKDAFLQGVMNASLVTIFFIACAGALAAVGAEGVAGLGVGIAAAAGCASVAYVAKLVIASRS